jgi:hypothetical protein
VTAKSESGARAYHLLSQGGVNAGIRLLSIVSILLATSAIPLDAAAQSGRKAFVSAWDNRTVVLKKTLYSIAFDERPRYLPFVKRQDRVAGLTVATWSDTYYRFEARRDSEEDIIERDPDRIVVNLKTQYYRGLHLDIGNVQDVEPLMLVRYEPGVELTVRTIQIERDYVRLFFHKNRESDLATTLTVQWPVPLSKELTESSLIDDVLMRFLAKK